MINILSSYSKIKAKSGKLESMISKTASLGASKKKAEAQLLSKNSRLIEITKLEMRSGAHLINQFTIAQTMAA